MASAIECTICETQCKGDIRVQPEGKFITVKDSPICFICYKLLYSGNENELMKRIELKLRGGKI